MFPALQVEIMDRFTAIEQFHRNGPRRSSELAQTTRGLVFIQIYAVYEYTVKTLTRQAILQIASHGHKLKDLRPPLLTLFLDAELKSLRETSDNKVWASRLSIFERSTSDAVVSAVNAMPNDGSHFRHTQLQVIFRTFGVSRSVTVRKRHLYSIDEIVNNRNSIAHGEETAAELGRRYSHKDVSHLIRLMRKICLRLVFILGEHCSRPELHCTSPRTG